MVISSIYEVKIIEQSFQLSCENKFKKGTINLSSFSQPFHPKVVDSNPVAHQWTFLIATFTSAMPVFSNAEGKHHEETGAKKIRIHNI